MKKDIKCGDPQLIAHKTTVPQFVLTRALAWFAFSPTARPVLSVLDANYVLNNTPESGHVRFSLTTGLDNNAVGFDAVYRNTTAADNTATVFAAIFNNATYAKSTAREFIQSVDNGYAPNAIEFELPI
jgi:hypothetical protein